MYGNEEAIGQGIQESIKAGEVRRKDLFIVSKLGNNHHAADAVLAAVQASLSKLQLDYLDLYHIHWCGNHCLCLKHMAALPAFLCNILKIDGCAWQTTSHACECRQSWILTQAMSRTHVTFLWSVIVS